MTNAPIIFDTAAIFSDPNAVISWRQSVEPFQPPWVSKWLESGEHMLQPHRAAKLVEAKHIPEQQESSWLEYLVEMSSFYGYSPESVYVVAAEVGALPPVELQHHKVLDLSAFFPVHLCKSFFVLPFSSIPETGLVNCAVLEPSFVPYVEELLNYVRGRWISRNPVDGVFPVVFQYFLAEPKSFFTFLGSIERAHASGL